MNVKANFRKATTKNAGKEILGAVGGSIIYSMLPTFLGMSGWGGFAVAALGTWGVGVLLDNVGMQYAAAGMSGLHLIYTNGQETVKNITGNYIWRFDTAAPAPPSGGVLNGLRDVTVALPGGVSAKGYFANDLPSNGGGMSDYGNNIGVNAAAMGVGRFGSRGLPAVR